MECIMSNNPPLKIKRALISVSDKKGLLPLVTTLKKQHVDIIATGGTAKYLNNNKISTIPIDEITRYPEAFSGRMKSLSFEIGSALLFRRDRLEDQEEASKLGIQAIDLVVCNLYPFEKVSKETQNSTELIENIDIGGPFMLRAAAKNYAAVCVLSTPEQYSEFIRLFNIQQVDEIYRRKLSMETFQLTAYYDSYITRILGEEPFETFAFKLKGNLRYGENPQQSAYWYQDPLKNDGIPYAKKIQGKTLSYNNILDSDIAWKACCDLWKLSQQSAEYKNFAATTIVKHLNPCGMAMHPDPLKSLQLAWEGDPKSSFGGIVCMTEPVTQECARWLEGKFIEVLIAPSYTQEALKIFAKKSNLRILAAVSQSLDKEKIIRSIHGGLLVQGEDEGFDQEFQTVTDKFFPTENITLVHFGILAVKYLKSNAVALVKNHQGGSYLVSAGIGQPNRVAAVKLVLMKAKENALHDFSGAILISDAFFPFADNIQIACDAGIRCFVQPGGSIRDDEVIAACNQSGSCMIFTGRRHFRH